VDVTDSLACEAAGFAGEDTFEKLVDKCGVFVWSCMGGLESCEGTRDWMWVSPECPKGKRNTRTIVLQQWVGFMFPLLLDFFDDAIEQIVEKLVCVLVGGGVEDLVEVLEFVYKDAGGDCASLCGVGGDVEEEGAECGEEGGGRGRERVGVGSRWVSVDFPADRGEVRGAREERRGR